MNDEEILELQMAEVELLEAAYENELDFETKEVYLIFSPHRTSLLSADVWRSVDNQSNFNFCII